MKRNSRESVIDALARQALLLEPAERCSISQLRSAAFGAEASCVPITEDVVFSLLEACEESGVLLDAPNGWDGRGEALGFADIDAADPLGEGGGFTARRIVNGKRGPIVLDEVERLIFGLGAYGGGLESNFELRLVRKGHRLARFVFPSTCRLAMTGKPYRAKHGALSADECAELARVLRECSLERWKRSYYAPVLDGLQWGLRIDFADGGVMLCDGSNDYPEGFDVLRRYFARLAGVADSTGKLFGESRHVRSALDRIFLFRR